MFGPPCRGGDGFARAFFDVRQMLVNKKVLLSALSVRARIIALALIPVAGFLANGIAFVSGEADVAASFASVKRAAALSDASNEFKASLSTMRLTLRDFASKPNQDLVDTFTRNAELAGSSLTAIEHALTEREKNEQSIGGLRERLSSVSKSFADFVKEQQALGYNDQEGVRRQLMEAARKVTYFINVEAPKKSMDWLRQGNGSQVIVALLSMQRYEADYRRQRKEYLGQLFATEFDQFNTILAAVDAPAEIKTRLAQDVKNYADQLKNWGDLVNQIEPFVTVINLEIEQMLPMANGINASVQKTGAVASQTLTRSQSRTRNIIIWVGCGAVLLGLIFSWLIGRSITRPLNGLAAVMKRLADGDTSARIPATRSQDEIGAMARTVIVFRDNMLERERLAAMQEEASRAREQRSGTISVIIGQFKNSVEAALAKLRASSMKLEMSSAELNQAADTVFAEATTAEQRVTAASENVTVAASSVDELAMSISDIASQATKSTEVAGRAVFEAGRTAKTMTELGNAATRIGEVIGLIQAIAGQTNLLALNATIEAARAGEAGRGFSVVASEVKSLASQTARATEEIAGQIGAIQSAAADAAQAIEQVNSIIEEMSAIASTVATTVEEQTVAVDSIAEGVNRASSEARSGSEAMTRVADITTGARATATDVKSLADTLAWEAENLEREVRRFLDEVQAA